jgi:cytidine deaminase
MTDLISEAIAARANAIAPWSKFAVGAALEAADGSIWRGCNVENASLGLTICAERVALLSAIARGHRKFGAIAVATDAESPAPPCGPCRQLLWEYCGDLSVTLVNLSGKRREFTLAELFPFPFELQPED